MPERIRLSRAKGCRLPENAVNVARPGRWGNPFIVGQDGTRLHCAAKFYVLSRGFIAFGETPTEAQQMTMYRRIRRHIGDLAGKDLACWCRLDGGACHADILLCLANPGHPRPAWWPADGIDLPRARLGMAAWDIERHKRKRIKREREAGE